MSLVRFGRGIARPSPNIAHAARPLLAPAPAPAAARTRRLHGFLPRLLQPEFWKSVVPRPFRRGATKEDGAALGARSSPAAGKKSRHALRPRRSNPATYYIAMSTLIGSMAIHMIALERDFANFMRRANTRLDALREAVEAIQRGETVDVKKVLGTGNPDMEREWEEGQSAPPTVSPCPFFGLPDAHLPGLLAVLTDFPVFPTVLKEIEHGSVFGDPQKEPHSPAASEKARAIFLLKLRKMRASPFNASSASPESAPKPSRPVFF